MSIFKELLSIKSFREGQAEAVVRTQRQLLQEAREKREAAEALLARLIEEGISEEHRLYKELCERIVKLRDIENVQQDVVALRVREDLQRDNVQSAIEAQTQQNTRLENARAAYKEASRQKSKFVDLSSMYALEQMREAERKEDLEMEEAASVRRDREEWDEHHPEDQT